MVGATQARPILPRESLRKDILLVMCEALMDYPCCSKAYWFFSIVCIALFLQ